MKKNILLKRNYLKICMVFGMIVLLFATHAYSQGQESTVSRNVLYVARLSEKIDIQFKSNTLSANNITYDMMFKGTCVHREMYIDTSSVDVYITDALLWIRVSIETTENTSQFLDSLIEAVAFENGCIITQEREMTSKVTFPIVTGETLDVAVMEVAKGIPGEYYTFVSKEEISDKYGVPETEIALLYENNQMYWTFANEKIKALSFSSGEESYQKEGLNRDVIYLLGIIILVILSAFFLRKRKILGLFIVFLVFLSVFGLSAQPVQAQLPHTDYVIMYKSSLPSSWNGVLTALHNEHTDYTDLTFTSNVSEKLSELQSIKPKYIIIVIEPQDGDPDFFDDADSTICSIDADEFEDAVWTVITGYTYTDAENLVNAPNASDDHTLTIANPDGSLTGSGYAGTYLESIISDDVTNGGGSATKYINTTGSADADSTASNLQSEINNDNKDCVLFLDHGNTNLWALRSYPSPRAHDYFLGWYSDLRTWTDSNSDGYMDTSYVVNNSQNSFISAEACLTTRINGNRGTNWSPWESASSNVSGTSTDSIALAWMEDSPGYYMSNDSVSYGNGHIKTVLLNMMKFGYTPAEAAKISKNLYHYIIGDETLDTNPADGTTDDFLLYMEREFLGIGDISWNITVAGTPPDYSINYSSHTQQDQTPSHSRGLVYVDTDVKWQCNTSLTFNQEIVKDPGFGSSDEDNSPFTFFFVEEVGGDGNSVWASDEAAVIGGVFKPTADTNLIQYASGDPSDPTYYLYDHVWYGAGTTMAYEIFKSKINTDEIVWVIGAGVTDYNSDSTYEWRINNGFSKSFNIYYWTPGVTQTSLGNDQWRYKNESSQTLTQVIAKVPVPNNSFNHSVDPSTGVSNITVVIEGSDKYLEFTIDSMTSGETKDFDVDYMLWHRITDTGGSCYYPDIAVNGNNVYITYADESPWTGGDYEICMKKSTDGGNTWAWHRITDTGGNCTHPHVAVDGNNIYIVYSDNSPWTGGDYEICMKKSTDGGSTWTWHRITDTGGHCEWPEIALDGNNIYVVYQDESPWTGGDYEICMKKSTDGGNTWTWHRITDTGGDCYYPTIAVDGSNIYIAYEDTSPWTGGDYEICMKKSTDGGSTWTWHRITDTGGDCEWSEITVDGNNIYIVYADMSPWTGGDQEICMKKSTDGGSTWTWYRITDTGGNCWFPAIEVNGNNIDIVYQDNSPWAGGDTEICMKKSTDGGNTWTWHRITDTGGNCDHPEIDVDGSNIYIVYCDSSPWTGGDYEICLVIYPT